MELLVAEDNLHYLDLMGKIEKQKLSNFDPGPVLPPRADGSCKWSNQLLLVKIIIITAGSLVLLSSFYIQQLGLGPF